MSLPSRLPGGPRWSLALVLLLLGALLTGAAHAQVIVDPCLSEVAILCDYIIHFSPPWDYGDPLGDVGLMVTLRDEFGFPIEGIPPSAFEVLGPGGPWTLSITDSSDLGTIPTDEEGRIFLTRRLQATGNAVDAPLLVRVTVDETSYDLDCNVQGTASFVTPDINGDGIVDIFDLGPFASCLEPPNYCVEADLNGNGEMDLGDQAIFMRYLMGFPMKQEAGLEFARPATKANEALFVGCLQRDYDDGDGPGTILDSLLVIPGTPFEMKILARDFDKLSGVELSLICPPNVTLLPGSCLTPEPPFQLGAGSVQGCGSNVLAPTALTIGGAPCIETGPLFVATLRFMTAVPQWVFTTDFELSGKLSDCSPRPTGVDACIGTPTPCEVSSLDIGAATFLTCPGGDLDLVDTVTLTLLDQSQNGVQGVSKDDIRLTVIDEFGSNEGDRFRLTALAPETDSNGMLSYRFEPRESCRWDGCFDLLISADLEGCQLSAVKRVRTLNLVRYEDDPGAAGFDELNFEDELMLMSMVGVVDSCGDFTGQYRCPVVQPAFLPLLRDHLGHSCSVTAAPDLPPTRWSHLEQNVPNPFNPRTRITVKLPHAAETATLEVYTLDGRFVRRIWDGALPDGASEFHWNGTDSQARAVSSGVYVARLVTEHGHDSIRMVLLR